MGERLIIGFQGFLKLSLLSQRIPSVIKALRGLNPLKDFFRGLKITGLILSRRFPIRSIIKARGFFWITRLQRPLCLLILGPPKILPLKGIHRKG